MNRFLILTAASIVCMLNASCRLLPSQKAPVVDGPSEASSEPTAGVDEEGQVAAFGQTAPGEQSDALSPVPGGTTAAAPPADPAAPQPAAFELPDPSSATFPGEEEASDAPIPAPPPAAELRGLRSPKLPSNLPMSLDGKVNP